MLSNRPARMDLRLASPSWRKTRTSLAWSMPECVVFAYQLRVSVFLFSLIVSLQVTLPSGLQYKVLEEGPGMDHPKVHTLPLMYMI